MRALCLLLIFITAAFGGKRFQMDGLVVAIDPDSRPSLFRTAQFPGTCPAW
jgi:hypothetical protein